MKRQTFWETAIDNLQERLKTIDDWYPLPALIGFGLVAIFSSYLLPGLNPRLGSPSRVMELPARPQVTGSIWLGLYVKDGKFNVVTDDRKRFGWDLSDVNQLQIEDLTRYLKGRVKKQIMNAGRTLSANTVQTTAVLAVDVELKYIHVRPVLHALAQARISHYGFETKHLNL